MVLTLPVILALYYMPAFQAFDLTSTPLTGNMNSGDYPMFWFAGHEAVSGRALELYDERLLVAKLITTFGEKFGNATWLYPPHMLVIYAALQAFNYSVGWLVFVVGTYAGFMYTVHRCYPDNNKILFYCALSPACAINVYLGQTGFLASALLIGGLFALQYRPVLAGLMIGLLTLKPQIGILLPFILLFERQYATFIWAAVTSACLVAASAAWLGPEVWVQYLTSFFASSSQHLLENVSHRASGTMVTLYGFVRSLGQPSSVAMAVQAVLAGLAVLGAFMVSRSRASMRDKAATYIVLCLLVSPYLMTYDLLGPALVAASILLRQQVTLGQRVLAGCVLLLPIIQVAGELVSVSVSAFFLIALAWLLVHQNVTQPAASVQPNPA